MTRRLASWAIALALGSGAYDASASPVFDDVNGTATPGFFVFGPSNIGWVYTPDTAFNLDGIFSTFRAVPNAETLGRTVTLSIWDETPGDGGSVLRSGTFFADRNGGALGITFAALELEASEDYFITFDNVLNLGLNIVGPINNDFAQGQPAGTEFLDGWYTGPDFATFFPLALADPPFFNPFAAPILRFEGLAIATPPSDVPEPATLALLGGALAVAAAFRRRRAADA
jgi:hypothetical protein